MDDIDRLRRLTFNQTAADSRITDGTAADVSRRLRHEHGVIADERPPDIVRFAPVPLYSTYHDCWRAARALAAVVKEV